MRLRFHTSAVQGVRTTAPVYDAEPMPSDALTSPRRYRYYFLPSLYD